MLEKNRKLRRIEMVFTDGQVNPECHYVYEDEVLEDGKVIMKKNHRENKGIEEARTLIRDSQVWKNPRIVDGEIA